MNINTHQEPSARSAYNPVGNSNLNGRLGQNLGDRVTSAMARMGNQNDGSDLIKVDLKTLEQVVKDKKNMYTLLTNEGNSNC